MSNYHYIVASLPVLSPDYRFTKDSPAQLLEEILELSSDKDRELIETLRSGWDKDNLTPEFYARVLAHRNRFIRDYFFFDLCVRNAKVEFLNKQVGRPAGTDVLVPAHTDEESGETTVTELPDFEQASRTQAALDAPDLLSRERALDQLYWDKIDELTTFDWFTIETILGFIARLHIVARWFELDEQAGREKFRTLVDEVRGSFKGVDYKA